MPKHKEARPSYIQVNRNLCNYPLARDPHTHALWRRSKKTGRMLTELPGEPRIQFRLAADADRGLRRLPTGCDVVVLLALLRAAHVREATSVEYASITAIIRDMGLEPAQRHRRAVANALALWAALGLAHDAWHVPQQGRGRLVLPPPIRGIDKSPGRLRIRLSPEWCDLAARYYVKVPRKLPFRAPLQNLILWLLTAPNNDPDPDGGGRITQPKRRRQLCRIIGVNHGTRNQVLARTTEAATRWFEAQGGALDYVAEGERVSFIIRDPKHHSTRKASKPRVKSRRMEAPPRPSCQPRRKPAPAAAKAPAAIPVEATDDDGGRYTMWKLPSGEYVDAPPRRASASDMLNAMMEMAHEK